MNQGNGGRNDVGSTLRAAALNSATSPAGGQRREAPRPELGPLAQTIAGQKVNPAISPVVIAGMARLAEFLLILISGIAIQLAYVYPHEGMPIIYPVAVASGAVLAILAFQAADIYSPHGLRSYGRQISKLAIAWLGVFALLALAAFMLKVGDSFSRGWMALWFLVGLAALVAMCRLRQSQ